MEIFNLIWEGLTTPNEGIMEIVFNDFGIPFVYIEAIVTMLLFTTVLNIHTTKKQKLVYVLVIAILSGIVNSFVPKNYASAILMIFLIFFIKFYFKVSIFKSVVAIVIQSAVVILLDMILCKLCLIIFNIDYNDIISISIYRISLTIITYTIIYILYFISKKFKININILDDMSPKNKKILILNFILVLIVLGTQVYITIIYQSILPTHVTLLSFITIFTYSSISLYSLSKTTKLEQTMLDLEESIQYNKTLSILHDKVRTFKHDFNNIVTAIGGYIKTDDMKGLKSYYSQLEDDCQRVNNLSTLNPEIINNPAIYSLLANKYHVADEKTIKINLEIFMNLDELNMKIYEFTKILGILLDNAIDASSECEEKIINLIIRKDEKRSRQLLIIENTYLDKNINTEKIFEKGESSKKNHTGLGLWEVRQILKKNDYKQNLFTDKGNNFFKQQLEMY